MIPADKFTTDKDCFLEDPEQWTLDMARECARSDGLGELNDKHVAILLAFRRHYLETGNIMPPVLVCHKLNMGSECVHTLFGNEREAWRLAGLPDPGEEALTYMH